MQEFWYDYVKQKYGEKAESCQNRYRQFHCIHKNK